MHIIHVDVLPLETSEDDQSNMYDVNVVLCRIYAIFIIVDCCKM